MEGDTISLPAYVNSDGAIDVSDVNTIHLEKPGRSRIEGDEFRRELVGEALKSLSEQIDDAFRNRTDFRAPRKLFAILRQKELTKSEHDELRRLEQRIPEQEQPIHIAEYARGQPKRGAFFQYEDIIHSSLEALTRKEFDAQILSWVRTPPKDLSAQAVFEIALQGGMKASTLVPLMIEKIRSCHEKMDVATDNSVANLKEDLYRELSETIHVMATLKDPKADAFIINEFISAVLKNNYLPRDYFQRKSKLEDFPARLHYRVFYGRAIETIFRNNPSNGIFKAFGSAFPYAVQQFSENTIEASNGTNRLERILKAIQSK